MILAKLDKLLGKNVSSEMICQSIKTLREEIINLEPTLALNKKESSLGGIGQKPAVQHNPVDQDELQSK